MSIPVITFFNNKGGVGKTSLVYHLAWMLAEQGHRVLAVDLDPQSNLTAALVTENALEGLWNTQGTASTVYECVAPLLEGTGDLEDPALQEIAPNLFLLCGDITLSSFEDELSAQWSQCLDGKPRAYRVVSAFARLMQSAGEKIGANLILADVGPNLGAINRAALVATDSVVVPLSPDLFSLRGMHNLGPTLRRWRSEWQERIQKNHTGLTLPSGSMVPRGYVVLQHSVRLDRPVQAYERWTSRIPAAYHRDVLDKPNDHISVASDPECLALLKHYRSLMPMAQEARKPIFLLRTADGAIGAHARAVTAAYEEFATLANRVLKRSLQPTP